jgi:hypothetical protein
MFLPLDLGKSDQFRESEQDWESLGISAIRMESWISLVIKNHARKGISYQLAAQLSGIRHNSALSSSGDDASTGTSAAAQHISRDLGAVLDHNVAAPDVKFDLDDNYLYCSRHSAEAPSEYRCVTQVCCSNALGFYMVSNQAVNQVDRWTRDSRLSYYVRSTDYTTEKPLPQQTLLELRAGMKVAAQNWNAKDIGVTFKEVTCQEDATFVVLCDPCLPDDTYARAFFPGRTERFLKVGRRSFSPESIAHISNVLSHELGHILGLRHTEWQGYESGHGLYYPTISLDLSSIMNRKLVKDLSLLVISDRDAREAREFYALPKGMNFIPHHPFFFEVVDHSAQTRWWSW